MVVRALILAVLCSAAALAQKRTVDNNLHAWIGYFGDHAVSDRWGLHVDAQWRRHDFFSEWQQYVVRPAANFAVTDSFSLTAGYLFGEAFPFGDFPISARAREHRLFQQAAMRHAPSERLALSQRYRLEQRFVEFSSDKGETGYRHRNRFRYQLGATTPLGGVDGRWYLAISDEFMVNFGQSAPNVFDQNRVYAALGRKAGRWGSVETGYMHQFIQRSSVLAYESNHTVQLKWTSSAPLR